MKPITIILPTLSRTRGKRVMDKATKTAGCPTNPIIVHDNHETGFNRTVNRGLDQWDFGDSDVLLLNDDVSGFYDGWLDDLRQALYCDNYGIIGIAQERGEGTREVHDMGFWCVLIRKEVFEDIGFLDEGFYHYRADRCFCRIAQRRGWKCGIAQNVVLNHEKNASGMRDGWLKHDIGLYNRRGCLATKDSVAVPRPFFSVVTRCHCRPNLLAKNIISVDAQTDRDIEQIFIPDFTGNGIPHANKLLYYNRYRVWGDYVFILDDDNELAGIHLVETIKEKARAEDYPDIFVVRGVRPTERITLFPDNKSWRNRELKEATTNAHCYIVKHEVWKHHIKSFGFPPTTSGAWQFPKALIDYGSYRWVWVDIKAGKTTQKGHRIEECEDDDWWERVLEAHPDIEKKGEEDWRRELWKRRKLYHLA